MSHVVGTGSRSLIRQVQRDGPLPGCDAPDNLRVSYGWPSGFIPQIDSTRVRLYTMNAPEFQRRMTHIFAFAALLACAWPGFTRQALAEDQPAFPTLGTIERADARFDQLVAPDAASRADRRGVRLVRGTGLGPERQSISCSRTFRATPSSSGRKAKA